MRITEVMPSQELQPPQEEVLIEQGEFDDLGNKDLPFDAYKQEFREAVDTHQVVLVVGGTGTGKSTQALQQLLACGFTSIKATQPRRPAAQNVAERVREEIASKLGAERAAQLVSCQTGAGRVGPKDAIIQVMTEETELVKEDYQPTDGTGEVLALDEWHEKSSVQFELGGAAKKKLARNPDFRVVVLSATMDLQETIEYWTSEKGVEPAVIIIEGEGTLFPVEVREERHSDTVRETVKAAIDIFNNPDALDGSKVIQVFEAGEREIKDTIEAVSSRLPLEVLKQCRIVPNYAKLSHFERAPVYEPYDGIKIIVQTNIGKTSITIPGTRYVISSGIERVQDIDDEIVDGLLEYPSSQDSLLQEKGRGGRTNSSIFILTKHEDQEFIPFADRDEYLAPEILRSNIDKVAMRLAFRGDNIRTFDGLGADKITELSKNRSIHRLQAMGVLDGNEEITSLGRRMARYPASPEHQRCLVEAEDKSVQVKLAVAAMIAVSEIGGIKVHDRDSSSLWEALSDESGSDALAQLDTFIAVQERFKSNNFKELRALDLNTPNLMKADELYRKIASRWGIYELPELKPPTPEERAELRQCLIAGFINSVYLPQGKGMFTKVGELSLRERKISDRSVVPTFTRSPILGRPRNIQAYVKGKKELLPIIENVTEISYAELGRAAVQLTSWVTVNYSLRKNGVMAVQQQVLGKQVLNTREVQPESSPAVREAVIRFAKLKRGEHLNHLYSIKTTLEAFAHKSRTPVPRLTQDMIDEMIEAAAVDGIRHPSLIEHNLHMMIQEKNLTLESFLPKETQDHITANAPATKIVDDIKLRLTYRNGKVTVNRYSLGMITRLPDELTLDDGRIVCFMYDDKRYTVGQLKRKIEAEGLY